MAKEYTVHYKDKMGTRKVKLSNYAESGDLCFTGKSNGISRKGVIVNPEINFFSLETYGLDSCFIQTTLTEDELFDLLRKQGYNPIWTERK